MASPRPDDLPTPEQFAKDRGLDIPEVIPVVQTFAGVQEVALAPEAMRKWAGEPSEGTGLGGSVALPQDATYDPHDKPSPWAEVGVPGLQQYGGFVRDEFLLALQGDNWLKTIREMLDNDPIVGALMFAIQMLVRKVEWRVEPAEGASVEDIVQKRIDERNQQLQVQAQAQQQNTMMAQAGMAQQPGAGARSSGMTPGKPGQVPPPQQPRSPLAQGQQPRAIHAIIPGSQNPENGVRKSHLFDRARRLFTKGAGDVVPGATDPSVDPNAAAPDPTTTGSYDPLNPTASLDPNAQGNMGVQQPVVEMTEEERKGLELAVFVETCLHDLDVSWADLLSQIVTFIFYGFALHEIVYKKREGPNPDDPATGSRFDDGKIGWGKLAGRAQETRHRWEFDPKTGDAIGMWQLAPPKYQLRYIPLQKALLFRTTAYKGNPEGRSVLRPAYRAWHFLKRIQEFEAVGIERDLAGLPVAKVPYEMMTTNATPEQRASVEEIKRIVRNLRRNEQEGVVFPNAYDPETHQPLYTLELLSSPSRRQFDTDKVITRYEQRIAMTTLADFILLGHDGVGARSLGDSKKDLFTTALTAFLNIICDVFNAYAIPRLMQMNGEDPAMSPKLTYTNLEEVSIAELSQFIQALVGSGADLFPDPRLEDHLREKVGLPPKMASQDL